jgi:hypothetical protein
MMKVVVEKGQQKVRRKASAALLAYDLQSGLPIGQVIDMSAKGMKLMSEDPVRLYYVYYCRIRLPEKIKGQQEVFFDAECRWCKKNEATSWYDSGYILRYPSPEDADIVRELTRSWMVDQVDRLNVRYTKAKKTKRRFLQRILNR